MFLLTAAALAAEPPLVTATLVADVDAIAAGQSLHLGVRYDIAPGWHIYWLNPGESGMETWVDPKLPDGWTAQAVQYPGPSRFTDAGGLVNYGYADSATLIVPVSAPETMSGESAQLTVETGWLVCREKCVQGSDVLSLTVPLAETAEPTEALDAARSAVPRPSPPALQAAWQDGVLRIRMPGSSGLTLFPALPLEAALDRSSVLDHPDALTLVPGTGPWRAGLAAVLHVAHGPSAGHYQLTLSPPPGAP